MSTYHRIIITGASSGLGEEFARQLAKDCRELVLIARRAERLNALATELRALSSDLNVTCVHCDLHDTQAVRRLENQLLGMPPQATLLINNAGLGDYGDFSSGEWEKIDAMIQVNMTILTRLSYTLLPTMKQQGGGIINISSLASQLPIPDFAVYAATKAYVLSLSEALRLELKEYNINVLAVCPGPVVTEFGQVARRSGFTGNMMPGRNIFDTTKETVVRDSMRAFSKERARVFPSKRIWLAAKVFAMIPMCVLRLFLAKRPRKVTSSAK